VVKFGKAWRTDKPARALAEEKARMHGIIEGFSGGRHPHTWQTVLYDISVGDRCDAVRYLLLSPSLAVATRGSPSRICMYMRMDWTSPAVSVPRY